MQEKIPLKIEIGRQLTDIRQNKGLSQRALARLCNVSDSTIAKIENARRSVGLDVLERILDALGCTLTIDKK